MGHGEPLDIFELIKWHSSISLLCRIFFSFFTLSSMKICNVTYCGSGAGEPFQIGHRVFRR